MGLNSVAIRILVDRGLSSEDILAVAEALELDTPRSSGARRQARYRARKKAEGVTGDVTSDVTGDVTSPPKERSKPPVPFPDGNGADPGKTLFDQGVRLLTSKGASEKQARAVIAKFQRDFGDPAVLDAINRCRNATEPISAMRDRLGKVRAQAEYYGP